MRGMRDSATGFAGHDEPVETFARDRLEARLEVGAIHVQLRQRDVKTRRGLVQSSLFLGGSPGEITQEGDAMEVRDGRLQELEPFRAEVGRQQRQARDVAARPGEFRRKTDADEIPRNADNRNRGGQRMRLDQRPVPRHQHVNPERQKLRNQLPRSRRVSLRVALLQEKVAAEDVSAFLKPLAQARDAHVRVRKIVPEIANARNFPLRPRRRRPRARRCGRRPAEKTDELAPPHSITSSAGASSIGGMSTPSALAVFRLTTVLNFVACSIGMSPGFAPLESCPTKKAARRNWSKKFTP